MASVCEEYLTDVEYCYLPLDFLSINEIFFAKNEQGSAKFMEFSAFRRHCVNTADMLGRR